MQDSNSQESFDLPRRVYLLTQTYVLRRTDERSPIKWSEIRNHQFQVPAAYKDAREKVCADAFYALRACRTRKDFVEFLVGTLCSVPQPLPPREYDGLSSILLDPEDSWQDARALAMLAISSFWSIN